MHDVVETYIKTENCAIQTNLTVLVINIGVGSLCMI